MVSGKHSEGRIHLQKSLEIGEIQIGHGKDGDGHVRQE
jgi:hypothetical protein